MVVVACAAGKKLQSITLLFAIYQVRPSPFCVLDELDAPLDESNISRFVRVLQRFLVHSQFVIITHNKRTIGMADVLYGVTMQEHGVSKIVSVKFHKNEEPVTDHTPTPLVPPSTVPPVEADEDTPRTKKKKHWKSPPPDKPPEAPDRVLQSPPRRRNVHTLPRRAGNRRALPIGKTVPIAALTRRPQAAPAAGCKHHGFALPTEGSASWPSVSHSRLKRATVRRPLR